MTCEQAGFNEPWPVPFGTDRRKAQHEGLTFIANLDSSQHAFLRVARYVPQSILQNLWIRGICLFQGCKRQMPRQQGSTQKVETLGPILFILFDINSFGRSPANGTLPRHQHNGRLFLASGFGIWRDVKRKEQIGIFPKLNQNGSSRFYLHLHGCVQGVSGRDLLGERVQISNVQLRVAISSVAKRQLGHALSSPSLCGARLQAACLTHAKPVQNHWAR